MGEMSRLTLPSIDSDRGLARYYREIWAFPVLKPDEEYMLAVRWREHGDVEAAHRLVTSHLRLVAKIAAGYRGYGLPMGDLIAEGNMGLMKAVKKFEPQRGFRLATYAMWWICAAITEYVLRSWSLVKVGTLAAQKKLFFSLGRIKRQLSILGDGPITDEQAEQVADALDVSMQDVIDMDRRLGSPDVSLNAPRSRDDADGSEFLETLVDEAPGPEALTAAGEEKAFRQDSSGARARDAAGPGAPHSHRAAAEGSADDARRAGYGVRHQPRASSGSWKCVLSRV